jgi:nucleoside phosphorylase
MSNLTPEQQRVVDAVVTVLLEQPGSGRQWVSGSELRFALKDLERQHRNEVIQSCVPRLLLVPPGQDDSYQPTLDGLLEAADSRTTRALEIALRLISDRYAQASGRRQRALLWSDVRKQGAFERGDFDVVWYTLTLGQVAHAGRPPVGASNDPRSPRYDYEFWLREQDLELIYENRDIHAWAAVQRARIAAMMLPHEATLSSSRSVLTETPKLPATVHSQTAIGTSAWTPESARSKVDIGILTIRDDEFRAVLAVFPSKAGTHKGTSREYTLRHADAGNGERYTVAVLRLVEQGHGEAQDAARDLIDDLAPRLVLVVGIAGGLPSDDVTLGDVVISTRIHDFTIEARKSGQEPTYAVTGGPIAKALAAVVTNLAAREDELGSWTADLPSRPAVTWTREGQLYGSAEWQHELREKLEHHHGEGSTPRAPVYAAGPIASSDRLVKDPELLIPWLQTARNLLAIEMESGGVYRAVRERCPMLAIRGISDIVGLKRADAWTKFACASAAAFTRAFLRTRPIEVGASTGVAADPQ